MRASEAMARDVVTIGPGATIVEAAKIMRATGHANLPVIDEGGRLLGLLSVHRIILRCLPKYLEEVGDLYRSGEFQPFIDTAREIADSEAAAIMDDQVPTVGEDAPLAEIAALMVLHQTDLIPVVREGVVLGVISLQDVMNRLSELAFTPRSRDS